MSLSNDKVLLLAFLANNVRIIETARVTTQKIVSLLHGEIRTKYQLGTQPQRAGLHFLNRFISAVEINVAQRLKTEGVLYWLMLSRKLPMDSFVLPPPQFSSTRAQIRRTFDLAIIRFAPRKVAGMVQTEPSRFAPLVTKETLAILFEAFFLVEHLYDAASCYRRVYKGAHLDILSDRYECPADTHAENSMQLFDKRKETFGGILDGFGYAKHIYQRDIDELIAKPQIEPMIFYSGFARRPDDPSLCIAAGAYQPTDLLKLFRFWQDMAVQVRGLQPLEFVFGLSALAWSRFAFDLPGLERRLQIGKTDLCENGFSMISKGAIHSDLKYVWPRVLSWFKSLLVETPLRVSEDSIADFLQACRGTRQPDLHTWTSAPVIIQLDTIDLIDWMSVTSFFIDLLPATQRTQRVTLASDRGHRFEAELRDYLSRNLSFSQFGKMRFWPTSDSKKAEYPATKKSRDVDLGVICGDTLILVECKVKLFFQTSLDEERRHHDTMQKASLEWLNQVDATAASLAKGETTLDGHCLPANITKIVPLVCSPHPIFTPITDPHLMLTDDIPRVCTPAELLVVIHERLNEVVSSKVSIDLQRNTQ
jgi:hypothetical protein